RSATQLLEMAIESLDLGEEAHVERVSVQHADRVVRIDRGHEVVPGVPNRLQMARRDVASRAGEREVPRTAIGRHLLLLLLRTARFAPATSLSSEASRGAFTASE